MFRNYFHDNVIPEMSLHTMLIQISIRNSRKMVAKKKKKKEISLY